MAKMCCIFGYRKAFDSVPHLPLLLKLENLGFNKHILQWISGYLAIHFESVRLISSACFLFKYLSVLLSHDPSWGEHCQSICTNTRKMLGLLYKRFYNNVLGSTLLQLCISLVMTHLDYASAIWSPYLSKDTIELENLHAKWLLYYGTAVTKVSLSLLTFEWLKTQLSTIQDLLFWSTSFNCNQLLWSPCTT